MQCKDCNVFEGTEGIMGVCKKHKPDRVVTTTGVGVEQSSEIVNGWPVVNGERQTCGDFE